MKIEELVEKVKKKYYVWNVEKEKGKLVLHLHGGDKVIDAETVREVEAAGGYIDYRCAGACGFGWVEKNAETGEVALWECSCHPGQYWLVVVLPASKLV